MCFSQEYSISFAILGIISLIIFKNNKNLVHNLGYIPIIFYTIMEIVQALQYSYVNECNNPINRLLTEAAYILVLVQPLMWNYIFLKKKNKLRTKFHEGILYCAIVLCIVWIIGHVIRRFDFYGSNEHLHEHDKFSEMMQGTKTCTYKNPNEHLYWKFKINSIYGLNANWFMYLILWFVPGLLVPEGLLSVSLLFLGALFSWLYVVYKNQSKHIFPSLWCLTSSPYMFVGLLYSLYIKYRD